MKLSPVLLGMSLAFSAIIAVNAKPAPVVDLSETTVPEASTLNTVTSFVPGSLEEKVALIERKIDSRNKVQVNVQSQLNELQNEVDELRGITEQHSHQLGQVLERQRELYQELERRVNEALKAPQVSTPPAVTVNAPSTPSYSEDLSENESYDRALNMVLTEKRYAEAIPEFRSFNKKYPNSSYSANAHYWLGQLLYNKGDFSEAADEFDIVVSQHTRSNKRSDAMFKLAMVKIKLNNIAKSKEIFLKLIEEYPASNAAKLAQARLDALSN